MYRYWPHRLGMEAAYIGWFGNDGHGDLVLSSLKSEGVDTSHCRVIDGPSAWGEVNLVNGERVFGASTHGVTPLIKLEEEDYRYISQFDIVHTSVFSHLEDSLERLKQASHILSFDFSEKTDEEYLGLVCPWVDIAFFSASGQTETTLNALMKQVVDLGTKVVVITRGEQGSLAVKDGKSYSQGIVPVEVVDTMGAGDAYIAGFLVDYVSGKDIQVCMQEGAAFAAQNCKSLGAYGYSQPY